MGGSLSPAAPRTDDETKHGLGTKALFRLYNRPEIGKNRQVVLLTEAGPK
jgi:hypothetical protein